MTGAKLRIARNDADAILRRFMGEDLIGIVPRDTIPRYCEELYPDEYGVILDFMHVYDDDPWIDQIQWLPEDEAKLCEG